MIRHPTLVTCVISACAVFIIGPSTVTGIVGWNPCRNDAVEGPVADTIAIGSYIYVHCGGPAGGTYLAQCPSQMAWNREVNGCTDFTGEVQSPPRLIGPVNVAGHPPHGDVPANSPNEGPQSFPNLTPPLSSLFSGLSSTLLRPSSNAGGLAVNPCVVDDRGTLSPIRFHRHPDSPSKYLECVPEKRTIMVRRCTSPAFWSQHDQRCVETETEPMPDSELRGEGNSGYFEGHHPLGGEQEHHHQSDGAPSGNLCRPAGQSFYRPHPNNQSLYVQCSMEGRAFVRECARGLSWNQEAMTCDRSAPGTLKHRRPKIQHH